MKKYFISTGAGLIILAFTYIISNYILNFKGSEEILYNEPSKLVSVIEVKNSINPIMLEVDGRISSKNKIQLYSEVPGTINYNGNSFVEGNKFRKGELIYSINADEFLSSVKQSRSELQNLVASILPDIKIDFKNNFTEWEKYFTDFDINKFVVELPTAKSDTEKYYIVGKGVQSLFYKVKSLEERLNKFFMYAPFNGSIINVNVNEGTMVSPGILLGSFISDNNFELKVNIATKYASSISVNERIVLNINDKNYAGLIKRINSNIDEISQTVGVHIEFKNQELKDGMYVKTSIPLSIKKEGFSISRSILVNDSIVYVAEDDNTVGIRNVKILFYDENRVIVSGLKDGTKLILSNIPGIFKGMKIEITD